MAKKAETNWIYSYYQAINDGSITAGRWIHLLYDYLIGGLERKLFFYDQKKANAAVEWAEQHGFHTEGDLAPGSIKLELWQKAMRAAMFGIVDEDGHRQFNEVLLLVGRKNGKSTDAAITGRYVWNNGGFGSKVFVVAPKLEQADIVYNHVWQMTQLDPEWQAMKEAFSERDHLGKKIVDDSELARHRQTDLFIPARNAAVKKIPFSARRSDGFNPSLCICDEIAAWEGDKGLKQYEVMASAMGARPDGLLLSCTTSGYVNDGIFDELMKRSTRFLLGDSKETTLLPFLYMIDDVEKWNDINELRKANPNLGVSVSVKFMLNEIAKAEGSFSKRAEFLTKYCCIKQNSSLAWLQAATVDKAVGAPLRLEDFRNTYAVVGVDLSQAVDLTAAVCVIERDGILNVFAKFFLPAEKIDEATTRDGLPYRAYIDRGLLQPSGINIVDYRDCYRWITSLVEEYRIYPLKVGYDRYCAQPLIHDLTDYGAQCDDVFQGTNLTPIIHEMEGLLKDGVINIGDNDLLKIHLLNAALKYDSENTRCKLVKLSPSDHVDGTAALLDALCVRQKWYGEIGEQLKNE